MGGGSAGVSAGLSLLKRGDVTVALVESGQYDEDRIGESLSTQVKPFLQYLDVWNEFNQSHSLVEFTSASAWGNRKLRDLDSFSTPKFKGWNINRMQFDSQLAKTFSQRGGNLMLNTKVVLCTKQLKNVWEITVKDANGETKVLLVDILLTLQVVAG